MCLRPKTWTNCTRITRGNDRNQMPCTRTLVDKASLSQNVSLTSRLGLVAGGRQSTWLSVRGASATHSATPSLMSKSTSRLPRCKFSPCTSLVQTHIRKVFSVNFPTVTITYYVINKSSAFVALANLRYINALNNNNNNNKSVFRYLRTLTTWHCPHSPAARRCAAIGRNLLCAPGQHTAAKRRWTCTRQSRFCPQLCQIFTDFKILSTHRLSHKRFLIRLLTTHHTLNMHLYYLAIYRFLLVLLTLMFHKVV